METKATSERLLGSGEERTVMFSPNVPVFIPVDSPDHSNSDAHGSQHQRAHGQLPASDGEAAKAGRKQTLAAVGGSAQQLLTQTLIMILVPHRATASELHQGIQTAEQGRGRRQAEDSDNDINWVKKEEQQSEESSPASLHQRCAAALRTQDVVEKVHEQQHPRHQGHKEDHLERRVEEELAALCFALSSSVWDTFQSIPGTDRQ